MSQPYNCPLVSCDLIDSFPRSSYLLLPFSALFCPSLPFSALLCPALPGSDILPVMLVSCFSYIPLLLKDFWASNPNPNQYTQGTLLGVYLWETTSFSLFDLLVPHVSLINSNCLIPQGGAPNPVSGYYTRGTLLGSSLHFQD